jgi:hypothetical protein
MDINATQDRQDVISRIRNAQSQLRTYGVARLKLFGSFVRGEQHSDSDVDLLVEFAPGRKTFDNFLAVCELLEASLKRRVELLTTESLSPHIGPRIMQEALDVVVPN